LPLGKGPNPPIAGLERSCHLPMSV
jgi:hypothetical protein